MGPRWCQIHSSPGEVQDLQGHEGALMFFMLKTKVPPALTALSHPGVKAKALAWVQGLERCHREWTL